jgi:hypothetical protein
MPGFADFLRVRAAKANASDELKRIVALADANSAKWPSHRNDVAAYVKFLDDKAEDGEREKLISALVGAYGAYDRPRRFPLGMVTLAAAGVFLALALGYGIYSGALIGALGSPEYARGLITFLFATGTIAVVLIVAIAIFWVDVSEVGDRFTPAKDLLTILIGVLGTILGFYFGTAGNEKASALSLADVVVAEDIVAPGGEATITGALSGGTAPYAYAIDFEDGGPDDIARTAAEDGAIETKVKMKAGDRATVVHFTVVGSDAAGHEARVPGRIFVAPAAGGSTN